MFKKLLQLVLLAVVLYAGYLFVNQVLGPMVENKHQMGENVYPGTPDE